MDQKVEAYINSILTKTHSLGVVTYSQIYSQFDDLSLAQAKQAILDYSEKYEGSSYCEFYEVLLMHQNGVLESRLVSEEQAVEVVEGDLKDQIEGVELYGIAKGVQDYVNFLSGNINQNVEFEPFEVVKNGLEFEANPKPIRAQIREKVIGDSKLVEIKKQPKAVTKPLNKSTNSSGNFRDVNSKAGMQTKADAFFKKGPVKTSNKAAPKKQNSLNVMLKPKNNLSKNESNFGTKIGQKRTVDDMEVDVEPKKSEVGEKAGKSSEDMPKRIKQRESDQEKAKFDVSNLYSVEESSGEPDFVPPTNFNKPKTAAKKQPKGHVSDDSEDMNIDGENSSYNANQNVDNEEADNQPTKQIVTKRVRKTRTRTYKDEDGFECYSDESYYEDEQVEVEVSKKPLSKQPVKKQIYKPPAPGQGSIANFFNRK